MPAARTDRQTNREFSVVRSATSALVPSLSSLEVSMKDLTTRQPNCPKNRNSHCSPKLSLQALRERYVQHRRFARKSNAQYILRMPIGCPKRAMPLAQDHPTGLRVERKSTEVRLVAWPATHRSVSARCAASAGPFVFYPQRSLLRALHCALHCELNALHKLPVDQPYFEQLVDDLCANFAIESNFLKLFVPSNRRDRWINGAKAKVPL